MKQLLSTGLLQTTYTTIGNLLGTALSAIAVILFIRILGPVKYGEFSVGFAVVLILTRVIDLGLNTAIVKYAGEYQSQAARNFIYSYTLKLKLLISLILMVIGLLSYKTIAHYLGLTEPLIVLISFTFGLATGYYDYLMAVLQSLHIFYQTVMVNAIQAVVKLIAALALLWLGTHNLLPPYFWYVVAPVIPVLFFFKLTPSWLKLDFKLIDPVLKQKILTLSKHASIGVISLGLIDNLDIFFVQKYLSTYETGLYGGVSRVALFFAIVAYSLGNVLNARVARYKSREHLASYLKKALILAGLIITSFVVFIPLAKPVILLTIGADYLAAQSLLLILVAAALFSIAVVPFIALFYSLEANWYFSVAGILQLLIVFSGNLIYVPAMGLTAAAWTRFAVKLFLLIFTIIAGWLVFKKQYPKTK